MADVGSTNIRLGASVSGFLSGMRQAGAATRDLTYQINTNLTDSFRRADAQAKTFRGGLTRLGGDIQNMGKTMTGLVTLPAIIGTGQAYKDFANLEKLQKGLDRFGVKLETVREIAKLPNIGLFDGAKIIVGLRSVNVETEKATRLVKAFGNAIAESGGSAADLEPAMNNIKEFFSTQKIDKVDLKEISARVPQMNAALMSAFGTTSTEALNKIGVDKVVEGLLVELEKIPPVAGGAQAAMDAMGDSATVASATFGQVADKVFDITGKINRLGGMLETGAEKFSTMSAGGQKAALAFGAIAAAAGPVLLAVGSLVKLWPTLVMGFSAMAAPLTVGIGLLAATVIYWNDIAGAITKATIAANNFFAGAASAVGLDSYAERLRGLAKQNQAYLDNLNGVKGSTPGADLAGNKKALAAQVSQLKQLQSERQKVSEQYKAALKSEDLSVINGLSKRAKALDADIAKRKELIASAAQSMALSKGAENEAARKAAAVKVADGANVQTAAITELGTATKEAAEEADKLTKAQMDLWRIDLAGKFYQEGAAVKSATEEYKKLVGVTAGLDLEKLQGKGMNFNPKDKLGALKDRAAGISPDDAFKGMSVDNKSAMIKGMDDYNKKLMQTIDYNTALGQSFETLTENLLVSGAEMIGGLLSGVGSLAQLPAMIGGVFGQMMKDLGKSFVQIAITAEIAKKALFSNPALAIGAGVVLIAAGTALQNTSKKAFSAPAFADGGMVYGDMMARVGDNPQARFDPEMIAPYSKVHASIQKSVAASSGGGAGIEFGEIKLRGEELYLQWQRVDKRKRTIG